MTPLTVWPAAPGFLLILVATAFPERSLFPTLIQNLFMPKFGFTNRTLPVASFNLGSHLNNGPEGQVQNVRTCIEKQTLRDGGGPDPKAARTAFSIQHNLA